MYAHHCTRLLPYKDQYPYIFEVTDHLSCFYFVFFFLCNRIFRKIFCCPIQVSIIVRALTFTCTCIIRVKFLSLSTPSVRSNRTIKNISLLHWIIITHVMPFFRELCACFKIGGFFYYVLFEHKISVDLSYVCRYCSHFPIVSFPH